jgi:hypothetical protein
MPNTRTKVSERRAKGASHPREPQGVARAIADAKTNPLSPEELIAEDKQLSAYGARQAEKLGFKEQDAVRIVHEYRRRRDAS